MPNAPFSDIDFRAALQIFESGTVRLTRGSGRWALFAAAKTGQRLLGHMSPETIAELRAKGHVVERRDGSLEPLRQRERASGRVSAQRPPPAGPIAVVNDAESPLTWLRTRKDKQGRPLISDMQFLAGERLRADFERSLLARRITANWDQAGGGKSSGNSAAELSDGTLAARQRHHAAMAAVGPELGNMLLQVCCLSAGLEQAERLLELPQRSGKAVLGLALNALARHYGLGGTRKSSSHWGAEGYRPAIPALEEA